ncbi:MAG: YihA family ribosome biogenesis GTP-binding protein [Clostridia bacterium]|nr:YihA family ribosome biogenesis GTP-binding protein [Clostridia bacterium]
MKFTSAKYLTSVVEESKILKDDMVELAFVGRSNVGKSSLINALVGQKNLAKTSSTPGLTKMINYFLINENFKIVDLPGYGYAKTGQKHIANWAGLMEKYLLNSPNLRTVFVLVDCRHKPSELDKMMLDFLNSYQIPYVVIATKVDKLAKSKIPQACTAISKELQIRRELIMPFSSENGFGKEKLLEYIESVVEG